MRLVDSNWRGLRAFLQWVDTNLDIFYHNHHDAYTTDLRSDALRTAAILLRHLSTSTNPLIASPGNRLKVLTLHALDITRITSQTPQPTKVAALQEIKGLMTGTSVFVDFCPRKGVDQGVLALWVDSSDYSYIFIILRIEHTVIATSKFYLHLIYYGVVLILIMMGWL